MSRWRNGFTRTALISWQSVDRKTLMELMIFGIKNSIGGLSRMVVVQTTALCLAASAGPGALAVFARPVALFSHADKFIALYAFLLTPVAGSLQGLNRETELRELLLSSLRASFAMTIPAVSSCWPAMATPSSGALDGRRLRRAPYSRQFSVLAFRVAICTLGRNAYSGRRQCAWPRRHVRSLAVFDASCWRLSHRPAAF